MTKLFNWKHFTPLRRQLRNEMPHAERLVWSELRSKQLGVKFRRQYSIGPFVVDFYCPKLKLAIEIDGDSHFCDGVQEQDKERQEYIESAGIEFLRFTNHEVYESLEEVVDAIRRKVDNLP